MRASAKLRRHELAEIIQKQWHAAIDDRRKGLPSSY